MDPDLPALTNCRIQVGHHRPLLQQPVVATIHQIIVDVPD